MSYGRRRGGCLSSLLSMLFCVVLVLAVWFVLVLYLPPVRNFTAQLMSPISDALPEFVARALYGTKEPGKSVVVTNETRDENGLAYASLNEEQKALYLQLLAGLQSREESFTVYDAKLDILESTYHAVLVDHPEIFWVDGSTHYTYFESGGPITVTPGLSVPLDQVTGIEEQLEAVVQSFMASVPADADDYDKAKLAYEYIIRTTDYDLSAQQNQNLQSALLGHKSVCAGYARAYQYLLQRSGVFCSFVEGTIPSTGEEHAWNLVLMDGAYTYVDVTWGDPTYPGLEESNMDVVYDYLGLTTEEILRDDHAFSDQAMWPK